MQAFYFIWVSLSSEAVSSRSHSPVGMGPALYQGIVPICDPIVRTRAVKRIGLEGNVYPASMGRPDWARLR